MSFWSWYRTRRWEQTSELEQVDAAPVVAPKSGPSSPANSRDGGGDFTRLAQSGMNMLRGITGGRNGGRPLPTSLRTHMEESLGVDLSSVRVQHDQASANALDARAYTIGDQIVLGQSSDTGNEELLAHETAHVAQTMQRGATGGISTPDSEYEREAESAGRSSESDEQSQRTDTGGPVPAIGRQKSTGAPTSASPLVVRESVRIMMMLQYQQQGGRGVFKLTPTVRSELRRLVPGITDGAINRIWLPAPTNSMVAFQNLINAGYLSLFSGPPPPQLVPPQAVDPTSVSKSKKSVATSIMGPIGPGFHLTINPQTPPPVTARIRQSMSNRGIPMTDKDLQSILAGREQGRQQVETLLAKIAPQLKPEDRTRLAQTIADALLNKGVQAKLTLDSPTAIERGQKHAELLNQLLGPGAKSEGGVTEMLKRVPVGVSVTIRF